MTQFLITALGSYGDVHPMVGLGTALAARGHRVKIVTNPYFEEVVTGARLEFVPLGSRDDYIRLSQHQDLWHPIRGPKLVLTYASARMLRPLYDLLVANYMPGETVYCGHTMDLASRVVGEKFGAPVANVIFAPGVLWTLHDSPRLKGALLGPGVPRWLKQIQFWLADTIFVQAILGGELNRLRRELGLAPVRRVFSRWLFASDLVLGLFPEWFGSPQPDWPPTTQAVGFPLWDSDADAQLSGEVQEFLSAGTPPIAFSPGSANRNAHAFFEAAVDACDRLGQRGILLTKYDHQLPVRLPTTVRHFGFVPLSKLLPRTAALVHHGGIGSCAQGLAAGVPHVVQPMSYDQFDNSRRLVRLGVAREVSVQSFRGRTVADALAPLLDSPTVAARCRELAPRCNGPAALAAACDALEQLAESHSARYK
ncbi:MAG: glycosyltransferase [Planctomycetes bacterium]|nr:glycosyltransferase [Planctomycetota bacterium]